MQEETLPEATVIPVAATSREHGLVSRKGIQVVDTPVRSLQSLAIAITADIII